MFIDGNDPIPFFSGIGAESEFGQKPRDVPKRKKTKGIDRSAIFKKSPQNPEINSSIRTVESKVVLQEVGLRQSRIIPKNRLQHVHSVLIISYKLKTNLDESSRNRKKRSERDVIIRRGLMPCESKVGESIYEAINRKGSQLG